MIVYEIAAGITTYRVNKWFEAEVGGTQNFLYLINAFDQKAAEAYMAVEMKELLADHYNPFGRKRKRRIDFLGVKPISVGEIALKFRKFKFAIVLPPGSDIGQPRSRRINFPKGLPKTVHYYFAKLQQAILSENEIEALPPRGQVCVPLQAAHLTQT